MIIYLIFSRHVTHVVELKIHGYHWEGAIIITDLQVSKNAVSNYCRDHIGRDSYEVLSQKHLHQDPPLPFVILGESAVGSGNWGRGCAHGGLVVKPSRWYSCLARVENSWLRGTKEEFRLMHLVSCKVTVPAQGSASLRLP